MSSITRASIHFVFGLHICCNKKFNISMQNVSQYWRLFSSWSGFPRPRIPPCTSHIATLSVYKPSKPPATFTTLTSLFSFPRDKHSSTARPQHPAPPYVYIGLQWWPGQRIHSARLKPPARRQKHLTLGGKRQETCLKDTASVDSARYFCHDSALDSV